MKVVAFAIAPVMMHRRHDWNTTAYAFRHRALQRGLPWKRRGRHDGFSMTSSVGSKAQEPYTAYLVQANTDRTSFTYVLSFFFFSSCCETAKHRRVKSDLRWNSWKKLEKDFKDFERMFRECINILYTLREFGRFEWNLENNFFVVRKKKKKRQFISILERVLSKIYEIYRDSCNYFFTFLVF